MFEALKKKIKDFVSDEDIFLQEFNQAHPELSMSIQKEVAKHHRIQVLRDIPQPNNQSSGTGKKVEKIWDEF
jgi:hypothetical protein